MTNHKLTETQKLRTKVHELKLLARAVLKTWHFPSQKSLSEALEAHGEALFELESACAERWQTVCKSGHKEHIAIYDSSEPPRKCAGCGAKLVEATRE